MPYFNTRNLLKYVPEPILGVIWYGFWAVVIYVGLFHSN